MSVGAIPFIQQKYASMFKPALTEANSVVFKDKSDLLQKLNLYLYSPEEKTEQLRNSVFTYYTAYLTPGKRHKISGKIQL